ncbi:tetratricopeptide repeat protein [Pseudoduganella sp. HUAS MS19]
MAKDLSRSAKLLKAAAQLGEADPQGELARYYLYGMGVDVDYHEARHWAELAAEKGSQLAQENLGEMLFRGLGMPKDEARAVELFQQLVDADDQFVHAKFRLAQAFLEGSGVPKDPAKGVSYLIQVVSNYRPAKEYFADLYAEGELIQRDDMLARERFDQCVASGSPPCQYSLANILAEGPNGSADLIEAARLYGLAASQGDGRALNNLGDLYEKGHGVPKDYRQAMKLYQRSANAGIPLAFWNIGNLLEKGLGVSQDSSLAYTYVCLAMRLCKSCTKWESDRTAIVGKLSPGEREKADAIVAKWRAGDPLPGFNEASASPAGQE